MEKKSKGIADWIGSFVMTNNFETVDVSQLPVPDYYMIYLSAGWCGPCKQFTPLLKKFYKTHPVEIIFLSQDIDEQSFESYCIQMPWLTVPWKYTEDVNNNLSQKVFTETIPTLIVLDSRGNILHRNAVEFLIRDPTGTYFPWISTKK